MVKLFDHGRQGRIRNLVDGTGAWVLVGRFFWVLFR